MWAFTKARRIPPGGRRTPECRICGLTNVTWTLGCPEGRAFARSESVSSLLSQGLVLAGQESDANLILVGHGGLYNAMLPALFTNVDHAFAMEHVFVNTGYALAENRPEGLRCLSWCGISLE